MTLLLQRMEATEGYTLGQLFVDSWFSAFTLEDAVRLAKLKGMTAIPAGKYEVKMTYSQRFQKVLPILLNVPNFEGIRIHAGNTTADTEGCILVGLTRGDGVIIHSRAALDPLVRQIAQATNQDEAVWIEIRDVNRQPTVNV